MFENWGFLLSEILGLMLVAALIGLAAGWLIWGRQVREVVRTVTTVDTQEVERLRALLQQAEEEAARYSAISAEAANARAALVEAQQTITEYAKASALAAVAKTKSEGQDDLLQRIADLENELEEAQTEGAEISNRYDELAEELAEHQRDALLMVERVSTLEHELSQYREEAPLEVVSTADPSIGSRPETLEAPRGGWGDDLTQIKGLGTVLEAHLHRLGIFHFDQIAAWGEAELAWIDENLEGFKGRASRDNWVEQARTLMAQ